MGIFGFGKNEEEDKSAVSSGKPDKMSAPVMGEAVPASIREAMAIVRGQKPSNDAQPQVALDEIFPISAAIEKKRIESEAKRKAEEEALKNVQVGQHVEGKGVFVGTWTPKDRDGNSLGKTFNLFAAPEDIGVLKTFNNAVSHVAGLKNWHGHNGFNHDVSGKTPDEALYDALRNGTYKGEWFIPTKDSLNDNLYKNKDKFSAENAFVTSSNGSDFAHWYWSCTERASNSSYAWLQRFTDGVGGWNRKDGNVLSVRCVRAELRP